MTVTASNSQSQSEILRASTILLIQIDQLNFGPWQETTSGGLLEREVTMRIMIEQILKGYVRQPTGVPFRLSVQQRGTGGFRVMDYYGLWSHISLSEGSRFVAFCTGNTDDATLLLSSDEFCEQLVAPVVALEDTQAALALEAQTLSDSELLAAAREAPQHGDIFARYVWAKTQPVRSSRSLQTSEEAGFSYHLSPTVSEHTANMDKFEAILRLVENPEITEGARVAYINAAYEELGMMDSPPQSLEIRLIQALLRILRQPVNDATQQMILQVYLPNLIGFNQPTPDYETSQIFQNHPDERQSLLAHIEAYSSAWPPSFLEWLKR